MPPRRIDLRKDAARVRKYLARRAAEYPLYIDPGPGDDDAEVRLITLGFQFEQAGWVALVFDTRPDAECDGQWQTYIEETAYPLNSWFKAFDQVQQEEGVLSITGHDGSGHSFLYNEELEPVAKCFGAMCREVLVEARDSGLFRSLPLAKECRLAVEEHDGWYGWRDADLEEEEIDESELRAAMEKGARKLSKRKKIAYWIDQLDRMTRGENFPTGRFAGGALSLRAEFVLDHLDDVANDAVPQLLEWANRWAGHLEYKPEAERTEDGMIEYPHHITVFDVIQTLERWGHFPPAAEPLLQQYVRTASQTPPVMAVRNYSRSKKPTPLYGTLAYHAARLLHENYQGYPQPKRDDYSNKLIHAKRFFEPKGQ